VDKGNCLEDVPAGRPEMLIVRLEAEEGCSGLSVPGLSGFSGGTVTQDCRPHFESALVSQPEHLLQGLVDTLGYSWKVEHVEQGMLTCRTQMAVWRASRGNRNRRAETQRVTGLQPDGLKWRLSVGVPATARCPICRDSSTACSIPRLKWRFWECGRWGRGYRGIEG